MDTYINRWRVPLQLLVLAPLLFSCATYHQRINRYYTQVASEQYLSAYKSLDHIKLLKKPRNEFLFQAEKGRVAHFLGWYDTSNIHLNEADRIAEIHYKNAGDKIKGALINPMMQTYYGEDFERFMLHYYKAINYLKLNQTESALVEARRISLANNDLDDRTRSNNKYQTDAFALNLQGLIYEAAGDWNNAFIAYRNAADTYLSNNSGVYYGVPIPQQLKIDLLRMALKMGFQQEADRYSEKLNFPLQQIPPDPEGGYLVAFMESGKAPIKEETNIFFTLVKGAGGSLIFQDATGAIQIPFESTSLQSDAAGLGALRSFRIALPRYQIVSGPPSQPSIVVNGQSLSFELAQNINEIAVATLQERQLKEITNAITRLALKKLAETGARAAGKAIGESSGKNSDKKTEEQKEKNGEMVGAIAGLLFQAAAAASEKADTRNWQSLPAYIFYKKIPLQKGTNQVVISGGNQPKSIEVEGLGNLAFLLSKG
jgi:hypothetical protein